MSQLNDSNGIFKNYAEYYDQLYYDKDYEKECDYLERIFETYSTAKPLNILDAGCGTGGHAIPLSKRGYTVTGIDVSGSMLDIARKRARKVGAKIDFRVADLRSFDTGM